MSEKKEKDDRDEVEDTKKRKFCLQTVDLGNYGIFANVTEQPNAGIKLLEYIKLDQKIQCCNGTVMVNKMIADSVFFKKEGFAEPKYELPYKVLSVKQFFLDLFDRQQNDLDNFDLNDYAEANEYLGGDISCLEFQTKRWFAEKGVVASVAVLASLCSSRITELREYAIRYVIIKRQPSFAWDVYLEMEDGEYKDEFVFYLNFTRKSL